jgi:hypothetical protein
MAYTSGLKCDDNPLFVEVSSIFPRPVKIDHLLNHMIPCDATVSRVVQFLKD